MGAMKGRTAMARPRKSGGSRVLLLAALIATLATAPATLAAATGTTPAFLAQLGGPNHAYIYPSGMDVAPDGTIVVADTGNDLVHKFAADGTQLWVVGDDGAGTGQFDDPRDIGIDSAGNIYVADTHNSRIVKLDPNGNWLTSWQGKAGNLMNFELGVSVKNDKVYIADTGHQGATVYDTSGTQLLNFKGSGACGFTHPRDVQADSAGNIYVVAYDQNMIAKFDSAGTCIASFGGTGTGPGQLKAPYGVELANDPVAGAEMVYVADANNNRIEEFTTAGVYYATIGGQGTATQPGTFAYMRRAAVAKDGTGDVWGADLWGWRVERFARTSTGYSYAQTIGSPLAPYTNSTVFEQPRGITFEANGTLDVADTVHHQIVRMSPSGTVLGTCGTRGAGLDQYNWPRGVAFDTTKNRLWVADTKQYRIEIINPATCAGITKFGTSGTGSANFNWPYSLAIRNSDRTVWVADTYNSRVKIYNADTYAYIGFWGYPGSVTNALHLPSGIAISPVNGHVFVADQLNNRVSELTDTGGGLGISFVRAYTGLNAPQGVAVDSAGNVIVANTGAGNVQVFNPDGTMGVTITAADGMDDPQNVAVDSAGNILVADTYNDRILKFASLVPPLPPDTTPPVVTLTTPSLNQLYDSSGPVTLTGTATDNVGVTSVTYEIQDSDNPANCTSNATVLLNVSYLQPNGTWTCNQKFMNATVASPGATSTTWSATVTQALPPGDYQVQLKALDAAGNSAGTGGTTAFGYGPTATAANPGRLTILFGRSQWEANNKNCAAVPAANTVTLAQVASDLSAMTPARTATTAIVDTYATQAQNNPGNPCTGGDVYASWDQLKSLRDTNGWSAVSATKSYKVPFASAAPGAVDYNAEICGSLTATNGLNANGFTNAWGMLAYPNNDFGTTDANATIQTTYTNQCFAFGRTYQRTRNVQSRMGAPYYQATNSVLGGTCNDAANACASIVVLNQQNKTQFYKSPQAIANLMNVAGDEWVVVQFYKFVTGSGSILDKNGNPMRWDCTGANWQDHYTFEPETYCYTDFLTAVQSIPANVVTTDPASVATAWGIAPPH
jgi:DNA-binding beta-propeller fold protein YncE